jgi:thiosulfate dehydrogenase
MRYVLVLILATLTAGCSETTKEAEKAVTTQRWSAPDTTDWQQRSDADTLRYGRMLVEHTSKFLGPQGSVAQLTNGMNCQNCHLEAGTKPFANNYALVATQYPRFRARSGSVETVNKRIADCFERSLNGTAPDSNSREMKALKAYILWVGSTVESGSEPEGAGMGKLDDHYRAANPDSGKLVYAAKCQSCHQANGQGISNGMGGYTFPPLWGEHSYNQAAGLYRLSRFASYVKNGMPLGSSHDTPQLSDAEAWDVAAYVNSQTRPTFDISADWPDISKKPVDHPFGPYADAFPETQHKYGPFGPIRDFYKKTKQ